MRFQLGAAFSESDIAEWRAGWRTVLGAGIGMGTGIALYVTVSSLFITRLQAEFGWSRGDLGTAGAVGFLAGAISLGVIGRFLDRVGFRRVVLVCVPGLSLVYLAFALQSGSFALYLGLMFIGGVFGAGTGAIAYTRPVIAAFDRQRGLALGVAASGLSLSAIAVPPLLSIVIVEDGWRAGLFALIGITLFVGLPLALYFLGQGRVATEAQLKAAEVAEVPSAGNLTVPSMSLNEAVRGLRFWLILVALVAVNIPGAGVVGQLAPMLTDKGLSESAAAFLMSTYAVGLLVGRLSTGFALDRLPPSTVGMFMTGVPAVGVLMLLTAEPSFLFAAVAVSLIGLQQGSEVDLIAYFVSRSFGFEHYSTIFGAIAMAGALSTATGLVIFGQVHDATGTYTIALIVGAVAFGIGAVAFWLAGRVAAGQPSHAK